MVYNFLNQVLSNRVKTKIKLVSGVFFAKFYKLSAYFMSPKVVKKDIWHLDISQSGKLIMTI